MMSLLVRGAIIFSIVHLSINDTRITNLISTYIDKMNTNLNQL